MQFISIVVNFGHQKFDIAWHIALYNNSNVALQITMQSYCICMTEYHIKKKPTTKSTNNEDAIYSYSILAERFKPTDPRNRSYSVDEKSSRGYNILKKMCPTSPKVINIDSSGFMAGDKNVSQRFE
ncbi:hypothetical protein PoB_005852900 [Plakobranchus ocellatus]|uniref:Uncharacterized protein n=1 Tax=Plakobranchus ocellatus TaxID=259542 RepID=A0AAV4CLS3_9GAST|nr:hypothetical protein PoB_005852900 [Plakobranchus ocellatus]